MSLEHENDDTCIGLGEGKILFLFNVLWSFHSDGRGGDHDEVETNEGHLSNY